MILIFVPGIPKNSHLQYLFETLMGSSFRVGVLEVIVPGERSSGWKKIKYKLCCHSYLICKPTKEDVNSTIAFNGSIYVLDYSIFTRVELFKIRDNKITYCILYCRLLVNYYLFHLLLITLLHI